MFFLKLFYIVSFHRNLLIIQKKTPSKYIFFKSLTPYFLSDLGKLGIKIMYKSYIFEKKKKVEKNHNLATFNLFSSILTPYFLSNVCHWAACRPNTLSDQLSIIILIYILILSFQCRKPKLSISSGFPYRRGQKIYSWQTK